MMNLAKLGQSVSGSYPSSSSLVKWFGHLPLLGSARNGSTKWIQLLARSGLGNRIQLKLSLKKLCAWYICKSASFCHPKANNLLDKICLFPSPVQTPSRSKGLEFKSLFIC